MRKSRPTKNGPTKTYDIIMTASGPLTVPGDSNMIALQSHINKEDYTKVGSVGYGSTGKIAFWGEDNQLPQRREALILDNNIVGQLIATKREITLGGGIYTYRTEWKDGQEVEIPIETPTQIADWLEENNIDDYLECAAGELFKHSNIPTEFIATRDYKGIARMTIKACKYMRAEEQDKQGRINNYYYRGNWGDSNRQGQQSLKAIRIPAFNQYKDRVQNKSIFWTGDKLFFDGYYFKPAYWGGKEWIKTSNNIPVFHQHNLENGYNLRYHIEIPYDYFLDRVKYDKCSTDPEREECIKEAGTAEQNFIDDMNKFLAGMKNSGRAVFTKYKHDMEKKYPGIVITPLVVDLKDDALLKLYEKSNDANISAQGIHPILASIQTQGKLSSGSDIRNALLLYLATKAPLPRKLLLRPLQIVQKINGWDKTIKFGFKDQLITKLDENPNGIESANGEKPLATIFNDYSTGVRAGLITPQKEDEDFARAQLGIPDAGKEVSAQWTIDKIRKPITLKNKEQDENDTKDQKSNSQNPKPNS